jgi:pimeloyl-ACP methyl ester carboxylesterase
MQVARPFDPKWGADLERTLPTPAGDIRYLDRGKGEPVVFYYPGSSAAYWQSPLEAAAGAYRALHFTDPAPSKPAAGAPPASGGDPFAGVVDQLSGLLILELDRLREQLGFSRVHFVTHSFGGLIAQQAALKRPDLFQTLVLDEPMGPAAMFDDSSVELPPPAVEQCALNDSDPVVLRKCVFTNSHSGPGYFESLPEPMRQYLLDEARPSTAAGRSLPTRADMRDIPSSLSCAQIGMLAMPILYIRGKKSTAFTQAQYDVHERCLPAHETVFIERAGHMTFWDQPDAFDQVLLKFIGEHAFDTRSENFASVLGFERASGDALPTQWFSPIGGAIALDRDIFHSGRSAARITGPAMLMLQIPADFTGKSVELRGWLRGEDVSADIVGLSLADNTSLASPHLSQEPIGGTRDWANYGVTMPLVPGAHTLTVMVSLLGKGRMWVDDLQLLVDGRPLREVPRVVHELTTEERQDLTAKAEHAGPPTVTENATIATYYALQEKVLRRGTNGWTCWAETGGLGPMCNQPGWDAWLHAFWNHRDSFHVNELSVSYMLAEKGDRHVMILVPDPRLLDGLSTEPKDPMWAMMTGTPYAHIMLKVGE